MNSDPMEIIGFQCPLRVLLTIIGLADLRQDTQLLLIGEVVLVDGGLRAEEVSSPGVGSRVEHVQTAQEQVV